MQLSLLSFTTMAITVYTLFVCSIERCMFGLCVCAHSGVTDNKDWIILERLNSCLYAVTSVAIASSNTIRYSIIIAFIIDPFIADTQTLGNYSDLSQLCAAIAINLMQRDEINKRMALCIAALAKARKSSQTIPFQQNSCICKSHFAQSEPSNGQLEVSTLCIRHNNSQ